MSKKKVKVKLPDDQHLTLQNTLKNWDQLGH